MKLADKKIVLAFVACFGVVGFAFFVWSRESDSRVSKSTESLAETGGSKAVVEPRTRKHNVGLPAQTAKSKRSVESSHAVPPPKQNLAPNVDKTQSPDETNAENNSSVTQYIENQNYGDMSPVEMNELLSLMTLGEGKEFEKNKNDHVVPLNTFSAGNPSRLGFLSSLQGRYRSDFIDSVPNADEQGYVIELHFSEDRIDASISLNSAVYYAHTITDLQNRLMIGKHEHLPPNLFIELPAKPEFGYQHPLYIEILIGSHGQTLIGILYNTNQNVSTTTTYLHAEHLIFNKIVE